MAQVSLFNLVNIDAVIADLSICDIVKTIQQIRNRGLSCSGRPHESYLLARLRVKRDIAEHRFIGHILKIHIKQAHISLQPCVGHSAVRFMGMLPGPDSGALCAFRQCSVVLLLYVHQCHITVVCLWLLIHQRKDSLCTCKSHNYGVNLVGHLKDVS